MGLFESDEDKLLKLVRKGKANGICAIAKKNPTAWETCLQSLKDYKGNLSPLIEGFLNLTEYYARETYQRHESYHEDLFSGECGRYYEAQEFCAKSACELVNINQNISTSSRELLYCLKDGIITKEQRWKLLRSLANDGNEWAETVIAAFFVISTTLKDGLFPSDELNYGFSITKKVIQRALKKYTNSYIIGMHSKDSYWNRKLYSFDYEKVKEKLSYCEAYHVINDEITEVIVVLYGFVHVCLAKNIGGELALQSLNLADQLKQKINELNYDDSGEYFMKHELCYYYYLGTGQLGVPKVFSQISCDELAELQYRIGTNDELFADTMEDYKQLLDKYKSAANSGNPAAMFSLAKVYYSGLGVAPKNEQNAKFWLKKAIDADVVEAIQFQNEHPELKEDGVKNISYHAEGDIIQGNSGIIAKDDAVVNRANIGGDANSSAQEYKFCMYCGAKLPAEARFCMKCGKQV